MTINDSGDLTCKQQLDELIIALKPHGYGKLIHGEPGTAVWATSGNPQRQYATNWWALTLASGEKVIYVGTKTSFDYWRKGVEAVYEAIEKRPVRTQ